MPVHCFSSCCFLMLRNFVKNLTTNITQQMRITGATSKQNSLNWAAFLPRQSEAFSDKIFQSSPDQELPEHTMDENIPIWPHCIPDMNLLCSWGLCVWSIKESFNHSKPDHQTHWGFTHKSQTQKKMVQTSPFPENHQMLWPLCSRQRWV